MSKNKNIISNNNVWDGLKINRNLDEGEILKEARLMPIDQIQPNPDQPRKKVAPEADENLAKDIEERGILQPIIVRPLPGGEQGQFQIIAGERRFRAAQQAGLEEVPVIIKELDDKETRMVSLIENLQRVDLDPHDEAEFFRRLANDYNLSNRQIAVLINRSHTYVDERMKLLEKGNKNSAIVQERSAITPKSWKYRPQNFQRFREYLSDTIDNFDVKNRDVLLNEVNGLKEELARLERKLKPNVK